YRFIRTGRDWYIDLPDFLQQGGSMAELQMVEGADKMLDLMAGTSNSIKLTIAKEPFEGADRLTLTEKCAPIIGGGYYFMKYYEGLAVDREMWLCRVTEFVFGEIPQDIYVRSEKE